MTEIFRYGYHGKTMYVIAPQRLCGMRKGRINEQLKALGTGYENLVLELSGCTYLDSTFMGQLISLRHEIMPQTLVLSNPSPEARQILTIMGLHKIIRISMEILPDNLEYKDLDAREQASPETMMEAHELLSQLSPENARRFELVIKSLKDSLSRRD